MNNNNITFQAVLYGTAITIVLAIFQFIFFDIGLASVIISLGLTLLFSCLQMKYFLETRYYRNLFQNFFQKTQEFSTYKKLFGGEELTQLSEVGKSDSDLNNLIQEINHYVSKTKGTTDFSVIQNKVERKLNMRYDLSTTRLSFPTFLGLMGTFAGVFVGIFMFIANFDGVNGVTDEAIKNLLQGVLVSMFTSLVGLLLTTINNAMAGTSRKQIEEDKNIFYDFIQTELMPSLDVSLVVAITKLHETVDRFEPAFNRIITNFQETFDRCTSAFGDSFEQHVETVSGAVKVMGENMDKINENIALQKQLINTMKSDELTKGMQRYIEASNHFVSITQSLDKFEEARRMMLAAAQEAINIQNTYAESLKIPREVAVRIAQILDRIKNFEDNVNRVGVQLNRREILGNDVVESIQEQIKGISKKGKIADRFLEMADGKLENLYQQQTAVLSTMNERYKQALEGHIDGFEKMIEEQTAELESRHAAFIQAIEERLSIEEVRQEFVNLKKLDAIEKKLNELAGSSVKSDGLNQKINEIKGELSAIKQNTAKKESNEGGGGLFGGIFGGGNKDNKK